MRRFALAPGGRPARSAGLRLAPVLLALAVAAEARIVPAPEAAPVLDPLPTAVVAQRGSVTLEQAIAMARRQYDGRVARAETVVRGGRRVHEITILGDGGRARRVRIDAETGRFLGRER